MDLRANEETIPKVMKMCIEEVEKRGLNIDKIYLVSPSMSCFRIHAKLSQSDSIRATDVREASGIYCDDQSGS